MTKRLTIIRGPAGVGKQDHTTRLPTPNVCVTDEHALHLALLHGATPTTLYHLTNNHRLWPIYPLVNLATYYHVPVTIVTMLMDPTAHAKANNLDHAISCNLMSNFQQFHIPKEWNVTSSTILCCLPPGTNYLNLNHPSTHISPTMAAHTLDKLLQAPNLDPMDWRKAVTEARAYLP